MSSSKLFAAGLMLSAIAGCGFEPIAAPTQVNGVQSAEALALSGLSITVVGYDRDDHFSYVMRKELSKFINVGAPGAPSLALEVSLSEGGLNIEQDDTVTRYNFTGTTAYTLTDPQNPDIVPIAGRITSITAANATSSQFSTSVESKAAYDRLAKDLANKMLTILRLIDSGKFPEPQKKDGDG